MILSGFGMREWGLATLAAIAAILLFGPSWWLITIVSILWFAVAAFFRDPLFRKPATDTPSDLVSPADGVISAVETIDHHPATHGPAVIVRIFLSVLDVHINRMPCACSVVSVMHTPGQYLDARSEESAKVNESNLLVLEATGGTRLGVRQVSGAIARRIVCPVVPGQRFERAARFGMIKFGSTTELIIPAVHASTVRVQKGARVVGGVTVLASLHAAPSHT
ncbi:MAG: phosphatidylserine decarboxylase family protein [Planctomycetes bacterium]|nr:phosphatidylserine decarboxylase family protein [Planctomycetota bacterium]